MTPSPGSRSPNTYAHAPTLGPPSMPAQSDQLPHDPLQPAPSTTVLLAVPQPPTVTSVLNTHTKFTPPPPTHQNNHPLTPLLPPTNHHSPTSVLPTQQNPLTPLTSTTTTHQRPAKPAAATVTRTLHPPLPVTALPATQLLTHTTPPPPATLVPPHPAPDATTDTVAETAATADTATTITKPANRPLPPPTPNK